MRKDIKYKYNILKKYIYDNETKKVSFKIRIFKLNKKEQK